MTRYRFLTLYGIGDADLIWLADPDKPDGPYMVAATGMAHLLMNAESLSDSGPRPDRIWWGGSYLADMPSTERHERREEPIMFPHYKTTRAFQEERYRTVEERAHQASRVAERSVRDGTSHRILTVVLALAVATGLGIFAAVETDRVDTDLPEVLEGVNTAGVVFESVDAEAGITPVGLAQHASTVFGSPLAPPQRLAEAQMNPSFDHEWIVPLDSAARSWHPYPS